jgi:hypothetical protein
VPSEDGCKGFENSMVIIDHENRWQRFDQHYEEPRRKSSDWMYVRGAGLYR